MFQAGGVARTDVANSLLPDNALVKFIVRSGNVATA
jgi:hypothetical protein